MLITRGYGVLPAGGGPGGTLVLADGIHVDMSVKQYEVLLEYVGVAVTLDTAGIVVDISSDEYVANVTIPNSIVVNMEQAEYEFSLHACTIYTEEGLVMQKVCAATVDMYRVLTVDSNGEVLHASSSVLPDAKQIIGISLDSNVIGNGIEVAISGYEIENAGWSWNTELPLYLGIDGAIVQTPPITGFVIIVGMPLTPTSMRIRIEMPIIL